MLEKQPFIFSAKQGVADTVSALMSDIETMKEGMLQQKVLYEEKIKAKDIALKVQLGLIWYSINCIFRAFLGWNIRYDVFHLIGLFKQCYGPISFWYESG